MYLVSGEAVERGDIADLDGIARLTGLVELVLCSESITDVSALQSMTGLTYLDLSGNDFQDGSVLASLENLSTLKLAHTGLTDLFVYARHEEPETAVCEFRYDPERAGYSDGGF